jgi:hypothetical protein
MKRTLLVLPLILVLSPLSAGAPDPNIVGIQQAVQAYLDGHATGDPLVMTRAFHQSARLQFVREGQYSTRTLEAYLGGMSGSPAEDEGDRRRRVVSIEYTGDAGVAKLELDYPGALITDYMQLLKIDGEWKIVNKIFTVQRR